MPKAFGIRYRVDKMVFLCGSTTKINVLILLRYFAGPSTDNHTLVVSITERTNLNREIDASSAQPDPKKDERDISTADDIDDGFRDDGSWYIGKARDEFHRRRTAEARREEEEDPVQVC